MSHESNEKIILYYGETAAVIPSREMNDVYLYDIPPPMAFANANGQIVADYDVPPPPVTGTVSKVKWGMNKSTSSLPQIKNYSYGTGNGPVRSVMQRSNAIRRNEYPHESYDVPPSPKLVDPIRRNRTFSQSFDDFPFNTKHAMSSYCGRSASAELLSQKNGECNDNGDEYDVPVPVIRHLLVHNDCQSYDVPPPPTKVSCDIISYDTPSAITQLSSSSSSSVSNRSSLDASLSLSSFGGDSNRSSLEHHPNDVYDIPPPPRKLTAPCGHSPQPEVTSQCYDIPSANNGHKLLSDQFYDIPPEPRKLSRSCGSSSSGSSSPKPSLNEFASLLAVPPAPKSGKMSPNILGMNAHASSGSSIGVQFYDIPVNNAPTNACNDRFYDIPKCQSSTTGSNTQLDASIASLTNLSMKSSKSRLSLASNSSIGSKESLIYGSIPTEFIRYDINEAIELQMKLSNDIQSAVTDLFQFVTGANWRSIDNLAGRVQQLENACQLLRSSVKQFLNFGYNSLANASNASDKSLGCKLSKLLKYLSDSCAIIESTTASIDEKGWTLEKLAVVFSDDIGIGHEQTDGRRLRSPQTPDDLDQLIACTRGLSEDVKHAASFIRGNAKLIFANNGCDNQLNNNDNDYHTISNKCEIPLTFSKPPVAPKPPLAAKPPMVPKLPVLSYQQQRHNHQKPPPAPPKNTVQLRPLPPVPNACNSNDAKMINSRSSSPYEDSDYHEYVSLESKESVENDIKESIGKELRNSLDNLVKAAESIESVEHNRMKSPISLSNEYGKLYEAYSMKDKGESSSEHIHANDRQLMQFYGFQLKSHSNSLTKAIEAFSATINNNQPPKVFTNYNKHVVVAVQKLIYIGDSVNRNVTHPQIRAKVTKCSNELNESLKTLVINTKKASLQFPSVAAVQEMVDSVLKVSQSVNQLITIIESAY